MKRYNGCLLILNFVLHREILPSKCKYLENIITNDLNDHDGIYRQCKIIYAHGNALIRKFYMRTYCVKCTLFKYHCNS